MEHSAVMALGVVGFALALANQIAARLRIPPVLVYLVIGALAGDSALHLVRPHELAPIFEVALEILVGLIVFEGAFAIDVDYLRRVGRVVRNLLTLGLAVTFAAGTVLAGFSGIVPWSTALVFGALVTVTGPTVIGPLVKTVRLNDHVRAVLIGEGVLIDPLGAILVVVVLQGVIGGLQADPLFFIPSRLAAGLAFGLIGAAAVQGVLRLNPTITATESQLMLLGTSIAVYALAAEVVPHSQLTAMATLGVTLAWMRLPHAESIRSYEDDLSLLMIGAIYVLAAATVDLAVLRDLWPAGVVVVLLLMVVVRPAVVFLSAHGSALSWRERIYIGAIGPRGVVAAALAAFAAAEMGEENRGPQLAALVFLTVFMTVAIQSTYAPMLAERLGVKAMQVLIAGAGALARRVGHQMAADGYRVTLIDFDPEAVERASKEGLEAHLGDVTDVRTLNRYGASTAAIAVAATNLDHANLLFLQYLHGANPEARLVARVAQPDAVSTFQSTGAAILSEVDTLATAMAELIGEPTLEQTIVSGVGDRIVVEVPVGSSLHGRSIRMLGLPPSVLVLLLRRAGGDIVPNGNTLLRRGDALLIFGPRTLVTAAREDLVAIA